MGGLFTHLKALHANTTIMNFIAPEFRKEVKSFLKERPTLNT